MAETPVPEDKAAAPSYGRSALPSLDLNALIKQALPVGSTAHIGPTISKLRDIQTQKTADLDPMRQQIGDRFEANRAQALAKREAIDPVDIQPWTQKRPENDPMRSFGSLGSVFAQIASAFTNTPMNNALEGSAAAMKAFRANQLADYEDAHQAWKDNTALALKRHDVQQQEYQDALKLMETDLTGGQAMLTMLAAKYGDEAISAMNQAGLYKEMNQVLDGRQRAAQGLLQVYPKLLEEGIQAQGYLSDPDAQSPDPAKRAAAYQRWFSPLRGIGGAGSFLNQERTLLFKKIKEDFIQKNGREPTITEESEMIEKAYSTGTARGAKDADAARENTALVKEIDNLIAMVKANPKVVGGRGLGERAKEAMAGIIDPSLQVQTPGSDFESKLVSARQRVNQALTNSKYYSKLRQEEMSKIMPGLESGSSAPAVLNALNQLRTQLAGAQTDEGSTSGAQNIQPPAGFTEPVTNRAGKKGWKNPATGKIWVQP